MMLRPAARIETGFVFADVVRLAPNRNAVKHSCAARKGRSTVRSSAFRRPVRDEDRLKAELRTRNASQRCPSRVAACGCGWASPRGPVAQRLNDGLISAAILTAVRSLPCSLFTLFTLLVLPGCSPPAIDNGGAGSGNGSQTDTETTDPDTAAAAPNGEISQEILKAIERIRQAGGAVVTDAEGHAIEVDLVSARGSGEQFDVQWVLPLKRLETLRVASGRVTADDAKQLVALNGLKRLALRNSQIDDRLFGALASLPELVSLDVQRSIHLTDTALASVSEFPKLRELILVENLFTDAGMMHLAAAERLQSLDLRGCSQLTITGLGELASLSRLRQLKLRGPVVNKPCLDQLQTLASLTSLTLEDSTLVDGDLVALEPLPLEELTLERCFNLTDQAFAPLAALDELTSLSLRDVATTGDGLEHLANQSRLQTLRLRQTGVSDDALPHLTGLPALRRLELVQSFITDAGLETLGTLKRLEHLDLEDNQLSDEGVAHLANLQSLRVLNLSRNASITDASVEALSGLSDLRILTLTETGFSAEGIEALGQRLAGCRIVCD